MNNFRDLEEYSDDEIITELSRRRRAISRNGCGYCGVRLNDCRCRFQNYTGNYRTIADFDKRLNDELQKL